MSAKYLIFGATGSIGSNLANKLYESNHDFHLVSRNENELKSLSEKLKCTYSIADVLEDNFIEKVKSDMVFTIDKSQMHLIDPQTNKVM